MITRWPINTKEELAAAYTPGVAEPCQRIAQDIDKVYQYTRKGNLVAIVTDGSAVLGLGNIGPEASLPVMEGKAMLFKQLAGVDAWPIALKTQQTDEIIKIVESISPMFGGINLEDISAPRCFEIEKRLGERLNIPVFHDDQHATAIVILAGLFNAAKVVGKKLPTMRVVINGAGAAGVATTKLLLAAGVRDMIVLDSQGIIYQGRSGLNSSKTDLAKLTNRKQVRGSLAQALAGADVFIGLSRADLLKQKMVELMSANSIIFALANPRPEIMPAQAKAGGAAVVATGRSDFPNQINNVLVFPGFFRGLLDGRINQVTDKLKLTVAKVLAGCLKQPTANRIIPSALDKKIPVAIAKAVVKFK